MNKKFRVWDNNKWVYHFFIAQGTFPAYHLDDDFNVVPLPHAKVQQFTGKFDINDCPIYEGDIVQFKLANQPEVPDSYGVYEVFYKESSAAFYLKVIKKNWLDCWFKTEEQAKKETIDPNCPVMPILTRPLGDFGICEVIGNVYENSALLKQ